jgi:hypothetical protein
MKGHILRYGIDQRDHLVHFLNCFYAKNANGEVVDNQLTPGHLGSNLSGFVYERRGKNFLVIFDGDDGSGITMADCKINWPRFQQLLERNNIQDYLVFKISHAKHSEHREFYPFKTDVYPFALMTNFPKKIFKIADEMKPVTKDIDVLFVGGKVHDRNYPYCWPKHRDMNQHWPTNRKIGYAKLLEIKELRKDLNIVAIDGLLPADQYYSMVNRTKICLDFPGISVSSRKFYEFMILGKCVVALEQNNCCWPLVENEHYVSLGQDYDYKTLESTIDRLLKDPSIIDNIGQKAASLRPLMSHEAVGEYVEQTVDAHVEAYFDGTLNNKRVWYK